MIGSMQHPELFARARHNSGPAIYLDPTDENPPMRVVHDERRRRAGLPPSERPEPNAPVNTCKGFWYWAVDVADEVIVVRKPCGALGAGTVDELVHVVGKRKPIRWE